MTKTEIELGPQYIEVTCAMKSDRRSELDITVVQPTSLGVLALSTKHHDRPLWSTLLEMVTECVSEYPNAAVLIDGSGNGAALCDALADRFDAIAMYNSRTRWMHESLPDAYDSALKTAQDSNASPRKRLNAIKVLRELIAPGQSRRDDDPELTARLEKLSTVKLDQYLTATERAINALFSDD